MKLLPLMDYEELYQKSPNAEIIPADVSSFTSKKQVTEFTKHIFMDGDIGVGLDATCECGNLTGLYLLGKECNFCKTEVKRPTATDVAFNSWIEIPMFLPPLLQPAAHRILKKWMGTGCNREQLLTSLTTVGSVLPEPIAEFYTPGVWSFYNNFDKLINFLLTEYRPLREPQAGVKTVNEKSIHIRKFIKMYRKRLFTRHFPVMDKSMHVVNAQGTMSFVDTSVQCIMKTVIELATIHYNYVESKNMPEIERCTVDMISAYYEYSEIILTTKVQKKFGLIRRHILGAKCHLTFRGVIIPIVDAADGDELYLPWGIGVQQHKLEIINILVNRKGHTPHQAQLIFEKAKYKYDPEVDAIIDTLIAECPYKGLPCILGRNPTLNHGAMQLFFVTRIKKDDTDDCISMSPLCLRAPNADFDGDALYGSMIKEMGEVPFFMNMHPMTTMLTEEELAISSNVHIGEQCCVQLSGWLNEPIVG